jgi:large subunit ribosomal protein L10
MAISKQKKIEVVDELQSELKNAGSVTFIAFNTLTVADVENLRRELRTEGVRYQVVKKTLLARALGDSVNGSMPDLDGNIAITWGEDPTASARTVYAWYKAAKDRAEKLKILGGIFESRYMNSKEMTEIATIPDQHTLRGMFVNIINTPIQQLVIALDKIAETKA